MIHEQNAYPGLGEPLAWGGWPVGVAVSFEGTAAILSGRPRVTVTGNPVRAEIRPGDAGAARRAVGPRPRSFTVLVFGGSQGAHRLNLAVPGGAARALGGAGPPPVRARARGSGIWRKSAQAYARAGFRARVEAFFRGHGDGLRAADFVICAGRRQHHLRAGGRRGSPPSWCRIPTRPTTTSG